MTLGFADCSPSRSTSNEIPNLWISVPYFSKIEPSGGLRSQLPRLTSNIDLPNFATTLRKTTGTRMLAKVLLTSLRLRTSGWERYLVIMMIMSIGRSFGQPWPSSPRGHSGGSLGDACSGDKSQVLNECDSSRSSAGNLLITPAIAAFALFVLLA